MGPWAWIDPGSIQDRSRIDPGSILDRSLIDHGSILDFLRVVSVKLLNLDTLKAVFYDTSNILFLSSSRIF